MEKIKRKIYWIILNGLMAYGLYLGTYEGNENIFNIVKFMIVFSFVATFGTSIWMWHSKELRKSLRKGPTMPMFINTLYSIGIMAVLLYYGHFVFATIECLQVVILNGIFTEMKKTKTDNGVK